MALHSQSECFKEQTIESISSGLDLKARNADILAFKYLLVVKTWLVHPGELKQDLRHSCSQHLNKQHWFKVLKETK